MTFELDMTELDTSSLIRLRNDIDNELAVRRSRVPAIKPEPDEKTYYVSLAQFELCVHARVSPLVQSRALRDLFAKRYPDLANTAKSQLLPSTPHQYAFMQRHEPSRVIEFQL